mmetsp:Transcript_28562/g.80499  ORF Transcript_28562/g.80499 Transcript_28562/m.80499 type:complete len:98 (+) Transcript_28562:2083-2376(+)
MIQIKSNESNRKINRVAASRATATDFAHPSTHNSSSDKELTSSPPCLLLFATLCSSIPFPLNTVFNAALIDLRSGSTHPQTHRTTPSLYPNSAIPNY